MRSDGECRAGGLEFGMRTSDVHQCIALAAAHIIAGAGTAARAGAGTWCSSVQRNILYRRRAMFHPLWALAADAAACRRRRAGSPVVTPRRLLVAGRRSCRLLALNTMPAGVFWAGRGRYDRAASLPHSRSGCGPGWHGVALGADGWAGEPHGGGGGGQELRAVRAGQLRCWHWSDGVRGVCARIVRSDCRSTGVHGVRAGGVPAEYQRDGVRAVRVGRA